jgi:hypothetical protein
MPDGSLLDGTDVEGWFSQSDSISSLSSSTASNFESNSFSDSSSETDNYSNSEFSAESDSQSILFSLSESESTTDSETFGENESGTEGESVIPVWVPIPIQELGSEAEWSREEKVSKVAEMLKAQQQRHCFIKLDYEKTQPLMTSFVDDNSISSDFLLEYEQAIYKAQGALPAAEIDLLLEEQSASFLTAARQMLETHSTNERLLENIALPAGRVSGPKQNIFENINDDPIGRE